MFPRVSSSCHARRQSTFEACAENGLGYRDEVDLSKGRAKVCQTSSLGIAYIVPLGPAYIAGNLYIVAGLLSRLVIGGVFFLFNHLLQVLPYWEKKMDSMERISWHWTLSFILKTIHRIQQETKAFLLPWELNLLKKSYIVPMVR